MDRNKTFLREIAAKPADNTIRLMYADWLAEMGGGENLALSELIQLQIHRHHSLEAEGGKVNQELIQREEEILSLFGNQWVSNLPLDLDECRFERGFLSKIRIEAKALISNLETVFHFHPIEDLELFWGLSPNHHRVSDLQVILAKSWLRNIRIFRLSHTSIGSNGAQAIALAAPKLACLEKLEIDNCHIGDAGLQSLILSGLLNQLHQVNLSGNYITSKGMGYLVGEMNRIHGNHLPCNLKNLDLRGNRSGISGLSAIRSSALLRKIVLID